MSGKDFLTSFNEKFNEFRQIEADLVEGKEQENGSTKAFALLKDMELCYASGAYYACLIVAFISIEACMELEFPHLNTMHARIKKSGYGEELDWLRNVRNKIVHVNDHSVVKFHMLEEDEIKIRELCKKAFTLVHTIYFNPRKI